MKIAFEDLYYSRQPLLFVLFFFTVHLMFRKHLLTFGLLAVQLIVSGLLMWLVLGDHHHQPHQFVVGHHGHWTDLQRESRRRYSGLSTAPIDVYEHSDRRPRIVFSDNITPGIIVLFQCMYAIIGIFLAIIVGRLFYLPRLYSPAYMLKGYRWIKFGIEMLVLFSMFLFVDEYIPETRFPIGIYRTFIFYTCVMIAVYYLNRTCEAVEGTWSRRHHMYNYDRCHFHWMASCLFLIALHFHYFVHGYFVTFASALALMVLYFCTGLAYATHHRHHTRNCTMQQPTKMCNCDADAIIHNYFTLVESRVFLPLKES